MEGVGARFGRSSTRYGPTTVFTGPVRKWKKKWVHVPPPNSHHHHTAANGTVNGTHAVSHLLFYRWTPIAPAQTKDSDTNGGNNGNDDSNKDDGLAAEEPPKKRFKYIPIVVLEEQKTESSEPMEDEIKPEAQAEANTSTVEATSGSDGSHEKPDINDVPMDENQSTQSNREERQDLNESTLDLSLGLKAHDDENESDSKADQIKDD